MKYTRFCAALWAAALILSILIAGSCSHDSDNANPDFLVSQNVVADNNVAIFTEPLQAAARFDSARATITDAVAQRYIDLFRAVAYANAGDTARCFAIHDSVGSFLSDFPDNASHEFFKLKGTFWNHRAIIDVQFRGKVDSAAVYYLRAIDALDRSGSPESMIYTCVNLADQCQHDGKLALTAKYYRRALFLCDSLNIDSPRFSILAGLGCAYTDLHNFPLAESYFDDADSLFAGADAQAQYFYLNNRGNCCYQQKQYPRALEYFKRADQIVSEFQNPEMQAVVDANIGEVSMLMGNIDSAEVYISRADNYFKDNSFSEQMFNFLSLKADLLLRKGDIAGAHSIFKSIAAYPPNRPQYNELYHRRLERYFLMVGDYRRAYDNLVQATAWSDSIKNTTDANLIAEYKMRYTQDTTLLHRNMVIAAREKQVTNLKILIISISISLILLVVAVILTSKLRLRHLKMERMKESANLISLQLENIRNRISPHFIFNILSRETPSENLANLIVLLQKNLELCDRYCISLAEEFQFIDYYCANEAPALGSNFDYRKLVSPGCDTTKIEIPSMMVQILVENALKHGLRGFHGDKKLYIYVETDGVSNIISIVNNGNIKPQENVFGTHTGIKIICRTIEILNDSNHNKIVFEYGPKADATEWESRLVIPRDYNFALPSDRVVNK